VPETPHYQRFNASEGTPAERFDHWRTWHAEAVDTPMRLEPVTSLRRGFRSSAEVLTVGEVNIVEVHCGSAVGIWRRADMEASDLLRVAIFHRARAVTGSWHGHEVSLTDGWAVIFGRTGGFWRAPNGFSAIFVTVPRTLLPVDDAMIDRVADRQLPHSSTVFGALVRPMLLGMVGQLAELSHVATADLGTAWISLISMMIQSLAGTRTDGSDLVATRRLFVHRYIDTHLADRNLGPATIAAALHVSRRSLYQLLSDDGEGVAAMIRRQRLKRARAMLLDPAQRHRRIADIAGDVGLPSPAHFSRLFRAAYGETPRELRTRTGAVPPRHLSVHSRDESADVWKDGPAIRRRYT
jgi:AraC-like DNA-binding protein